MNRRTVYIPYRPKTILNKSKHADDWFWTRYSAYPYLGCQHGCEFCYCRERKYSPYDDPLDFARVIKVKENAAALLRQALQKVPVDAIFTGDYQPAEKKFAISRQMLEVCLEMGFPVFVLERSPLVLRDLDLLQSIQQRTRAVVAFSAIYTPDSPGAERIQKMEPFAPPPAKRFAAMEKFASAGILTGICAMPLLPGLCDNDANLESLVRWTADHGGQFVLPSSLTLADQQRDYFFNVLAQDFPDLQVQYQRIYPASAYAPAGYDWMRIARRIHELCLKYNIHDRMPRPIIPGDRRTLNRRVVEALADKAHLMELDGANQQRIWAYRKAAWAVEELSQDLRLVVNSMGVKGLESIADVGPGLAGEIARLAAEMPVEQGAPKQGLWKWSPISSQDPSAGENSV